MGNGIYGYGKRQSFSDIFFVFVVFFFLELDGYFNIMMDTRSSMMDMMDMMPYFHFLFICTFSCVTVY